MRQTHHIYSGNEPIGVASIQRQGLYWHIRCSCKLTGTVIYKILAGNGIREESLGVLVPEGEEFMLETKIPVKRLGEEDLHFRAVPRHTTHRGRFIAVYPDEPFSYIDKLKSAYLERRSGLLGIVLRDEA